jgi:hypothetical protein
MDHPWGAPVTLLSVSGESVTTVPVLPPVSALRLKLASE